MATKIRKSKIEKYYQKIVIIFIALTVIIVGLIIYFSFSKTIISVTPKLTDQDTTFRMFISQTEDTNNPESIKGKILETTLEKSQAYDYVSELAEIPAKATGTVTIYNNYTKDQPLVSTTRLMSDGDVLFRTKETITVPAGSSIKVGIEADQAGASGNIGPAKFTIVALWPGLQEKIYAESTEAMTGGTKKATLITAANLSQAKNELIEDMETLALEELAELVTDKDKTLISQAATYNILEYSSTAEENEQVADFTLTMKLQVIAPVLEIDNINDYSLDKLKNSLATDYQLYQPDSITLSYTLENVNLEEQTATLRIKAIADSIIKISSPIFDRSKLTNKDKHEINVYFAQFDDEIAEVESKFSPFWVVRSPQLEDHIEIKLLDPITE